MNFNLKKSLEILERTPAVLETMLSGLSNEWTTVNEGVNTWSACDIVGHLIHGEKTDWIVRLKIILSADRDKTFAPFDRNGHINDSKGKTLNLLLEEFRFLRQRNLQLLTSIDMNENNLNKEGIHPAFGKVTLRELLATWTVHDIGHLAQICRVMAKQYTNEVGPWKEYLPILDKKNNK